MWRVGEEETNTGDIGSTGRWFPISANLLTLVTRHKLLKRDNFLKPLRRRKILFKFLNVEDNVLSDIVIGYLVVRHERLKLTVVGVLLLFSGTSCFVYFT